MRHPQGTSRRCRGIIQLQPNNKISKFFLDLFVYILNGWIITGIVESAAFKGIPGINSAKKFTILVSRKYTALTEYAEVIIADGLSLIPEKIFSMTLN